MSQKLDKVISRCLDNWSSLTINSTNYRQIQLMNTPSKPAIQVTRLDSGILACELVSDGKTGEEWVSYLLSTLGYPVSDNAQRMLRSPAFQPTPAGTIHRVRIIPVSTVIDSARTTDGIRTLALGGYNFKTPHPEVAPLMREAFTDGQILWWDIEEIATFHEAILGRFLDIDTETAELESAPADEGATWHLEHGVAFEE